MFVDSVSRRGVYERGGGDVIHIQQLKSPVNCVPITYVTCCYQLVYMMEALSTLAAERNAVYKRNTARFICLSIMTSSFNQDLRVTQPRANI